MGFMDAVKGFFKSDDTESSTKLIIIVANMIADPKSGGVKGLVKLFQDNGSGEQVKSWVSTEANLPISAEQIKKVFGRGQLVQDIASALGVSEDEAAGKLAAMLPDVIDKLTMYGQIPEGELLEQRLSIVKGDAAW
ncbi:MAG: YidB family protein [Smithellaceae bacterium]|nr:YidB family protein [Smithellaceae bacterium]